MVLSSFWVQLYLLVNISVWFFYMCIIISIIFSLNFSQKSFNAWIWNFISKRFSVIPRNTFSEDPSTGIGSLHLFDFIQPFKYVHPLRQNYNIVRQFYANKKSTRLKNQKWNFLYFFFLYFSKLLNFIQTYVHM